MAMTAARTMTGAAPLVVPVGLRHDGGQRSRESLSSPPGTLCLALQGIGPDEAKSLELLQEEDCLLRQLAGNGFCANICLVFLMAALFSW